MAKLTYRLPAHRESLDQLEREGQINSPASLLREFGFENCYIQKNHDSFSDLLIESAQDVIRERELADDNISRIFLYSGINSYSENTKSVLNLFRYPVAELRYKLKLEKANAIAISQQGCSGLLSAIDVADRLLISSDTPNEAILCAAADLLPHWTKREVMYNIMSDAAATVIVARNSKKNRIVHFHQQVQPYYWDTPAHENELLAAYFPMAERAIESAIAEAGLKVSDIKWFVPNNVSLRSWEILAKLLNIPMTKIWTKNISRIGHTVSCDHIINLADMEQDGVLMKGDYLALFTFGFGASWSCLILEH